MSEEQEIFSIYKIIEPLGEGGMGEVFLAEDTVLSRKVAIKFLRRSSKENYQIMEQRFQNEAKILASLNHPNIVSIYNFGKKNGVNYIVMEYVEGTPLSTVIKKGLSPYEALTILRYIAQGVEAAHAKGILHRDIKPANIILDKLSNLKIVDFGISKNLIDEQNNFTKTDHLVGTMNYMAPELLRGGKPSPATDIFSIGVVFYEMLFGSNPFNCQNKFETIDKIKTTNISIPPQYSEILPPELYFIFDRMIAKKPASRYSSMIDMLSDLDQVVLDKLSKKLLPNRERAIESNLNFSEVEENLLKKGLSQSDAVLIFQLALEIDLGRDKVSLTDLKDVTADIAALSEKKVSGTAMQRASQLFAKKFKPEVKANTKSTVLFSNVSLKNKMLKHGYIEKSVDSVQPQRSSPKENNVGAPSFSGTTTVSKTIVIHKSKSSLLSYSFLIVGLVVILNFFYKQITEEKAPITLKSLIGSVLNIYKSSDLKQGKNSLLDSHLLDSTVIKKTLDDRIISSVEKTGVEHNYPPVGASFQFKIQGYDENTGKVISNSKQIYTIDSVKGKTATISFRSDKLKGEMSVVTNQFVPPTKYRDSSGVMRSIKLSGDYDGIFPLNKNSEMSFKYTELKKDGSFQNFQQKCKVKGSAMVRVGAQHLNTYEVECTEEFKVLTHYFSPELGFVIKKVERTMSSGNPSIIEMELEKFHLPSSKK